MSSSTRSEMIRATQLILNGAGKGNFNLESSAYVLDEIIDLITKQIVAGEGLTIRNFGSFTVREYQGRTAPDPQGRGSEVQIPAFKAVTFKSAAKLKDAVNGREVA